MKTETLAFSAIHHHVRIRVATECSMGFIDLTTRIEALVAEAGLHAGLVNIQSLHATMAIVVTEHEPLLLSGVDALRLGSSVSLNVAEGRLQLGRWQRIFLVELDGPRAREVSVLLSGKGVR